MNEWTKDALGSGIRLCSPCAYVLIIINLYKRCIRLCTATMPYVCTMTTYVFVTIVIFLYFGFRFGFSLLFFSVTLFRLLFVQLPYLYLVSSSSSSSFFFLIYQNWWCSSDLWLSLWRIVEFFSIFNIYLSTIMIIQQQKTR